MDETPRERPVVVVGAGLTGASWAGLFAAAGREVRLYDADPRLAGEMVARAVSAAQYLAAHGLADPAATDRGVTALHAADDPAAAFAGVELMQECVTESLGAKRSVFAMADKLAPPDALLATSSSGLSISRIQEAARLPGRCLAAHPYNPPHLVPLVELAPGTQTEESAIARAVGFYRAVGKDPVVLRKDVPGYIANRLSAALWREAIDLVATGAADVAQVDQAVRSGPGLRWAVMGPHLLYHLGGGEGGIRGHLEHLGAVKETMLRDLATWTSFPPGTADLLEDGLRHEVAGRRDEELIAERDRALVAFRHALSSAEAGTSERRRGPWPGVLAAPGVTRTTLAVGRSTHLVRFDLEPGAAIPVHSHPHEQTGLLISGEVILTTAGHDAHWEPGGAWSIPAHVEHGARTEVGAVLVEAFSPIRRDYL